MTKYLMNPYTGDVDTEEDLRIHHQMEMLYLKEKGYHDDIVPFEIWGELIEVKKTETEEEKLNYGEWIAA